MDDALERRETSGDRFNLTIPSSSLGYFDQSTQYNDLFCISDAAARI